ncbi:MAG: RNA methyltransferase [Lachnospiraceae bacterium]|nr:RNA methyltransferase [Lachnospiraceae bacterium]
MEKITSTSNSKIKYIEKLNQKSRFRHSEGAYVIEGERMLKEVDPALVREVYVSENYRGNEISRFESENIPVFYVSDAVFKSMSDTKTPQGILGIAEIKEHSLDDMLKGDKTLLLFLEDIQDPGNLGTMIRTGEGAGVTGIVTSKNTVDLYSPKTVRSTMGSLFRVPVIAVDDFGETILSVRREGVKLYAAHLCGSVFYDKADYGGACGFLIGNEGNGLKEETAKLADGYIKIPMEGKVESLNAAIAATLLMYEVHRQRG